ncbi:uncharacterized protein LOC143020014 [Oratosquilla oratoria]|uniref:uncharacterized protein LOC143020014 n=1 Tax=Oratosquilla oratoria TaxID=337810 RepID=UPI003F77100F
MVSKPQELRQLGDDLTMAVATFGKLELYERFNTQGYILDILQRCQGFVRNKWKQKALSHKRETDTYPSLGQFAEFINVMADEACDPVYGLQSTSKGQNVRGTSCNVAASESKYPVKLGRADSTCVVCGEGHRLFYCEEFKGMKPECRLEVVKRHKLYFNCLLGGHGASKCFKQSICSVPGCGLKHTKFIHVPAKDSQGNGGVVENSECQASSVVMNGYVNDARSKIYLPILPVVVDNKLKVTALLDSGSDTTFVTERVALELGLKGDLKEYIISTVGGTIETHSKVVSLSLTSPDGRREARVTNDMVVPRVPVRQPPVKIEIDKFPYLKGIPLNTSQVSEPDILIGMDNAWLLKPLEVRGGSGGNKHQPYATRTYFGWSVNGPIGTDLLKKGYAEYVPEVDLKRDDGKVWYLPHHAVTSETKPGKVRVVFDCAAQKNGVSLNSQCLQGPDLNNKLIYVLLRFRQYHYAITADIEAMYHQVKIPISDRDALRFLWYVSDEIRELRMTSHPFGGIWCASSSTYALRKAVEDMQPCEEVKDTLLRSFYVDDMLKSVALPEETIKVIEDTRSVLRHGGYNLTKFMINDVKLLESINEQDRAKEAKELTSNVHSKVLGIKWDVENDCFFFVSKGVQTQNVTRRVMLSQLVSTYDPLGLVLPIIVPVKILFQKPTRLKMSWEESIPISLCQKWLKWIASLYEISRLRFSRCVFPLELNGCTSELHHFCDASEVAFGACTYMRTINQDGKVHVALLASKARVAPIKGVTIPRLEISAAVEAAKLDVVVRRELDIPLLKSNFWSDSTIALAYIQNETRRFKTFVANRVTVIRQISEANQWHHVSGEENPADVLSRGCFVDNLPVSWFNGPPFLSNYKCAWPAQDDLVGHLQDEDPEVRRDVHPTNIVQTWQSGVTQHPIDTLIEHYSSLYRLKKAVGRAYFHETKNIEAGKTVLKSSSIYKLSPILIDGLLVVGGRLKHAALNGQAINPVILPHNHRLSTLIVRDCHNSSHVGVEWTLSRVRKKIWIIRGRKLVKRVKMDCIVCKRLYGAPMNQRMSDLPPERCEPGGPAFRYVGVDLFGPFLVKVGRSEMKRYGCLYTCFTTRAIHIEKLDSLQTDAFINGFVRFTARRCYPSKVWSDNGTNLVGARAELARSLRDLDRSLIVRETRRRDVEWSFNPPPASHHGGVWERMVRSVRKILFALVIKSPRMIDDVLQILFCEAESIVNSRPLTKCSDDASDESPLTPNHLLLLQGNSPLSWGAFHDADPYRKHWRHVQHLAKQFWKRRALP